MINLVVPLSIMNDYKPLIENGANEFYAGFVPAEWLEKYQMVNSLNRREFLFSSSNIVSMNAMYTLSKYVNHYGVKVKIAINAHYFVNDQYELILDYMQKLIDIGFDEFIIADLCLLILIRQNKLDCRIHLSGEIESLNHYTIDFYSSFEIKRIVFPRKINLIDMENCICNNKSGIEEYEAFVLNSLCQYSGGFCNSIHCDDMPAVCSITRQLQNYNGRPDCEYDVEKVNQNLKSRYFRKNIYYKRKHRFGATGCGVCGIKQMQKAGVTHLKIVGRGYSIDKLKFDIQMLNEMIKRSYDTPDEQFSQDVKKIHLDNRCSECYYPAFKE